MGKAVVSTTVGAEGLPLNDGEHLLLADDPASFARCTLTLLRNPSMRNNLGTAARGLIERKYSWTTVSAGFATVLQDVVKRRTRYNDSQKN